MLLTVLSPAKSLNFSCTNILTPTQAPFYEEASQLVDILQALSSEEIGELMGISRNLSDLNYERFQVWQKEHHETNSKACIFAFNGDVYEGLDATRLSLEDLEFCNQHLRILSGMYGLLKPSDLIQAYRLEMGIKLKNSKGATLYEFWKDKITNALISEIKEAGTTHLIKLSSDEYSKAIDFKRINIPVIVPTFKEEKNGKLQFVSFYAKRARGLMTRYIMQNKIIDPEMLKGFNLEGYHYNERASNEQQMLFTR